MFKWLEKNLPKIVMAPAVGLIGWFVYGFVLWTLYISFTNSKILPKYELWGFGQYEKLWASRKWLISVDNLVENLQRVIFVQESGHERIQFYRD